MISAAEAKRKAAINSCLKQDMALIEKIILNAVEDGHFTVTVPIDDSTVKHVDALIEELKNYGYVATFNPAEPIPPGCPSDQWYSNNSLTIKW